MNPTVKDTVNAYGITYSAQFVPFSKSRNAKEKHRSLNWVVTLIHNGVTISTDYMQGVAHIPGYKLGARRTSEVDEQEKYAVENGKVPRSVSPAGFSKPIPRPELADILYCLLTDGEAIDYPTYEEWADNLGYDRDSRKGEETYRACVIIGLKLRQMFGDAELAKLRDLFQDY
jgi:hypothetical protein